MRFLLTRFGWSSVLLLAVALPLHAVEVRNLRLWSGPENTRLVLDLSGSAQHTVQLLQNPDRIVLDIAGAHLRRGVRTPAAVGGLIRSVHIAQHSPQHLRIVLGLAHAMQPKSFMTPPNSQYGYRLVVDLGEAVAVAAAAPVRVEHSRPGARDLVIAVDAGHGGEDPGAIGMHGTREKDVVLAIAKDLAQQINAEPGMKAVLTRDGDYFVPLRDRMRRARAQNADLFVSIHADSIRDRHIDGSSVYILSQKGASDEASRILADQQNASDLIGGVSLDDKDDVLGSVLLDVAQSEALGASAAAAGRVLRQLDRVGLVRKRQVQQARFMVLKSPDVPSLLVETAYISNPDEEQRLRGPAQQAKLAEAIHQGVRDFFYANPPPGSHLAQLTAPAQPAM
jgi:N-acetylmuramoyl-L-alanine amidase